MSRSYRVNIAHQHEVYRTEDVMALYQVSRNTITNWIAQGLRPVPGTLPKLFRGDELKRFQDFRSTLTKVQLRPADSNALVARRQYCLSLTRSCFLIPMKGGRPMASALTAAEWCSRSSVQPNATIFGSAPRTIRLRPSQTIIVSLSPVVL